ncbi:MAG: gamma-glutamyltransferase [Alphaproteobacteria bacterium]
MHSIDSGALAQSPHLGGGDRIVGLPFATRAPVIAPQGMAATAQPLASQIAIDVLKAGGSAVDAAIAANAALGLMEPTGCGIGGDLFALVWDPKTRRLYGLNASGRSPRGRSLADLKAKLGARDTIPPVGSLSVTVPGAVDGWFALHGRFGTLPMAEVLAPAIAYARDGFPVSQVIAHYFAMNFRRFAEAREAYGPLFEEFDNAKATYLVDGTAPAEGDLFRNPDLARTYDIIARQGRDAFYKGALARTMAAYFKRIGGDLTLEDFAAHESTWVEPLSVNYRGYDVYQLPPNTQGVAALQMLQMLKAYDLKAMGPGNPQALHVMVEAKRLAFEDRARYYADPDFARAPLTALISDAYADTRRALIDPDQALRDLGPGAPKLDQGDTTYLTVADKTGMMVSLIQSNYRGMGSGLVADGLGFMFQNRGELFALDPEHPNAYAPGKRPFHTIIPSFVMKDGEPFMSFGLMGGGMQPQGHVQVLVNMIDHGMNIQEAGDAARWCHVGGREPTDEPGADMVGTLLIESGLPDRVRRVLERKGHRVRLGDGVFGGYQAIMRDPETGMYWGASEMRKDGMAIGY